MAPTPAHQRLRIWLGLILALTFALVGIFSKGTGGLLCSLPFLCAEHLPVHLSTAGLYSFFALFLTTIVGLYIHISRKGWTYLIAFPVAFICISIIARHLVIQELTNTLRAL